MLHREIILSKEPLKKLYSNWYSFFLKEIDHLPNQIFIEIGSGGGFLIELEPRFICTDVIELPTNDLTFSALNMPYEDQSIGGIFMLDTMHHIPDSKLFLTEVNRVLAYNGVLMMIEPANTIWGRFIYKNFHHEPFNPEGEWNIPSTGPLSGANGALPWIVFIRDGEFFKTNFPEYKVDKIEFLNPLTYLFTGGVSHSQILPSFMFPVIRLLDRILPKISKHFSMFMLVKIVKTK